jgi:lipopolysaccharide biosynthesis glycosyltransferase
MKKCITLVSDNNYIQHTKYLFSALKFKGNWQGDFCLLANNVNEDIIKDFKNKGIHIFKITQNVKSYYAKYFLFNNSFKNWDVVCYFDADFVILNDINNLVESDNLLVDAEQTPLGLFFDKEANIEVYNEMNNQYDLNKNGFNSGCIIYNTNIIKDDSVDRLMNLSEKYKSINHHTGPDGTDQPILNLYFNKIWNQVNGVSFHRKMKGNDVAVHTCRWEAPWKDSRYIQQYNHYLNLWDKF